MILGTRLTSQRGAAALAVAMVLLFGMTLIAFFANRSSIFEQRTSANQYRATKAFEMADAGLEWAVARLNDDLTLANATCTPTAGTGNKSFRERYFQPSLADAAHDTGWFDLAGASGTTVYPGCSVNPGTGAMTCACPAGGGGIATLGPAEHPRFRVRFVATADPAAVEIISRGCTNGDPCDPTQSAPNSDATAMARVIVKIRPALSTGPGAGLISGSTTVVSGSLNVVNTETPGNGITINTGSNVNLSGSGISVVTIAGTDPSASILDNDPSLLKLTNADASGELFFMSFFGQGFNEYRQSDDTVVINAGAGNNAAGKTCSNETDCGAAVSYWVNQGKRQFWVYPSVTFNSSNMPNIYSPATLGTLSKPIMLATSGNLTTTGGIVAYGVFYAATASAVDDLTLAGGGSSTIVGSLISRGDFARTGNGNISIVYNGNLFGRRAPPTGILVPLPGSWRDKETAF